MREDGWKKKLLATHGGNYRILLCQECSHDGQAASEGGPCGLLGGLYGQFNELRHQMSLVSEGLKREFAPLFDGGSQMFWLSFGVRIAEGGRPRQRSETQKYKSVVFITHPCVKILTEGMTYTKGELGKVPNFGDMPLGGICRSK